MNKVTISKQELKVRDAARSRGEMRYEGHECPKCTGTLRFVANGGCVACKLQNDRSRYYRAQDQDEPLFLVYNQGDKPFGLTIAQNQKFLDELWKEAGAVNGKKTEGTGGNNKHDDRHTGNSAGDTRSIDAKPGAYRKKPNQT